MNPATAMRMFFDDERPLAGILAALQQSPVVIVGEIMEGETENFTDHL